jgi:hypothetical protein
VAAGVVGFVFFGRANEEFVDAADEFEGDGVERVAAPK